MELEGFIGVSEILRSGVYALVWRRQVVYVGKSKTMLVRIYSHRNALGDRRKAPKGRQLPSWFPVKGIAFDEVFIRPAPLDALDALERELIAKYRPRYNIALKPPASPPLRGMVIGGVTIGAGERFERRV